MRSRTRQEYILILNLDIFKRKQFNKVTSNCYLFRFVTSQANSNFKTFHFL